MSFKMVNQEAYRRNFRWYPTNYICICTHLSLCIKAQKDVYKGFIP